PPRREHALVQRGGDERARAPGADVPPRAAAPRLLPGGAARALPDDRDRAPQLLRRDRRRPPRRRRPRPRPPHPLARAARRRRRALGLRGGGPGPRRRREELARCRSSTAARTRCTTRCTAAPARR